MKPTPDANRRAGLLYELGSILGIPVLCICLTLVLALPSLNIRMNRVTPDTIDKQWMLAKNAIQNSGATLKTYKVKGENLSLVAINLKSSGPKDLNQIPREAVIKWKARWDPQSNTKNTLVHWKAEIVLPELNLEESNLSSIELSEWQRYWKVLLTHEIQHLTILRNHIDRINRQLKGPWLNHHKALKNRAISDALVAIRRADVWLDRLTKHGIKQGAVLRTPYILSSGGIPNREKPLAKAFFTPTKSANRV